MRLGYAALCLATLGSVAHELRAQRPITTAVYPAGGQRGQTVDLKFSGTALYDPLDLVSERTGLEVLTDEGARTHSERGDRAGLRVRIDKDCPLGWHGVRLRTATGIGPLLRFHVCTLPEATEAEELGKNVNDEIAHAEPFSLNTTWNGILDARDRDAFACQVEAGQRVSAEIAAVRLGGPHRDLALWIHGPNGKLLLEADDSALGRKDPITAFVAEETGTYTFVVGSLVPAQRQRRIYRLHVGTFPRPTAVHPVAGAPGETIEVIYVEPGVPPEKATRAKVQLPKKQGNFDYFATTAEGTAPTPVRMMVSNTRSLAPQERAPVKDKSGKKKVLPPLHKFPGAVHGQILKPGEIDSYYFRAKKGETIMFRLRSGILRTPLDGVLVARYASGRYISSDDDGSRNSSDPALRFRAPADGEFRIDVRDLMYRGSPEFVYRLDGVPDRRGFGIGVYTPRRYRNPTISVPRGGHMAHVLLARNFTGKDPVAALIEELPEGVTAKVGSFRRDTPYVPVVLSASKDAPLGATLAQPRAKDMRGSFLHANVITQGRNQSGYINHRERGLPTAVTEPAPFRLEFEPIATPIVAGSYLPVRVRLHRAEGFKGSVNVRMVWNPPGISSGTTTIAANKTTGTLYISARGDAAEATWPIALVGSTTIRRGTQEVSTPMLQLAVAKPWITGTPAKVRTERGKTVELTAALRWNKEVKEPVVAYLANLPSGSKAKSVTVKPGAKSVKFDIAVGPKTSPGRHRPVLRFKVKVPGASAEAVHQNYGAELRVNRPKTTETGAAGGGRP